MHTETLRIKQDATLALIAFDSTVSTSCTHLFFCNTGTAIKKLGDVEFLVEKSVQLAALLFEICVNQLMMKQGFFGSAWKPVTLLLCDGLLVVFRATGSALLLHNTQNFPGISSRVTRSSPQEKPSTAALNSL